MDLDKIGKDKIGGKLGQVVIADWAFDDSADISTHVDLHPFKFFTFADTWYIPKKEQ